MIKSINIKDPIEAHTQRAIEVDIELNNGQKRWCFFLTPQGAASCGDWIEGTKVRFHYGAPHVFFVADISEEIIKKALKHVENQDKLEQCTKLVE